MKYKIWIALVIVLIIIISLFFIVNPRKTEKKETTNTIREVSIISLFPEFKIENSDKPFLPDNFSNFGIDEKEQKRCKKEYSKFNNEPASHKVVLKSQEIEMQLEVPYNPKWGNEIYRLKPYQWIDNGQTLPSLAFGNIFLAMEGGCALVYTNYIDLFPPTTSKKDIEKLIRDFVLGEYKIKNINGLNILEYMETDNAYCRRPTARVIVLGEKHNYYLNYRCGTDMSILEDLIKTMKLLASP